MKPIEGQFPLPALTACPYCGWVVKSVDSALEDGLGAPGTHDCASMFMCLACDAVSVFADDGQLRKPTEEERAAIIASLQGFDGAMLEVALELKREQFLRDNPGESPS
jgi:hypothetical protein